MTADLDPALYSSPTSGPIRVLAQRGLINERDAVKKLAECLSIPYVDLYHEPTLSRFALERYLPKVSPQLCAAHKAIPLYDDGEVTVVAFANPFDIDAQKQFRFALDRNIRAAIAEEDAIVSLLSRHTSIPDSILEADKLQKHVEKIEVMNSLSNEECDLDGKIADSAPIIKLINHVLIQGMRLRASDIHFDPTPNGLDIRFRIDGVMQHVFDMAKRHQRPTISRLKLLAGMNISEKRAPQDGRFRIKFDNRPVDLRVSCVPTAYGEKVVIRILRSDYESTTFQILGIPESIQERLNQGLNSPGRMILVTGPTGSGKTTTLYTALKQLNDGTNNIETVEDPIEYKIPGINQIQISEAAKVTFASCLRSILRQDPDVIMVGEIRDAETANIALQAAQTGHLVLSTLHTNDAPSAITRLLNLGCDPFVMSSSLAGVMAQRLVRKICPFCKNSSPPILTAQEASLVSAQGIDAAVLRDAAGCERCRYTGYLGRVGIYSYLHVTPKVGSLIHSGAPLPEIVRQAGIEGFVDLDRAALPLLIGGITTLAEVKPFLVSTHSYENLSPITAEPGPAVGIHGAQAQSQNPTVLLVEDDLQNRTSMAFHLRQRNFHVIEEEDGLSALQNIKKTRPDVIVTGLGLPIVDGRLLLQKLRGDPEMDNVPIVVLTSADSDENEAELLRLGADDFISRSRSPDVVIGRIQKVLRK